MPDQGKRPFWLPSGGIGALLFLVGLCLFFAGTTLYYFDKDSYNEGQKQFNQDQEAILLQDNQQLRAQVDKLQTDLAEKGSILLNREQILQQTTESLKEAQKEKELQAAAAPPPDPKKPRHDLYAHLDQSFKNQPSLVGYSLIEGESGVIIRVNNRLLFNSGELNVDSKGQELLKQIGLVLKDVSMDCAIEVQSHTDDLAPTGSLASICPTNLEVSAQRAIAVTRVLSASAGIPAKNLKAVAMGENHPIVPNDTTENRALNRRVDIVLNPGD